MELNPVLEPGEPLRHNIWYVISSPTTELRPTARSGQMLVSINNHTFLLGGATPTGFAEDKILKFDRISHNWVVPNETQNEFPPIFEQLSVINEKGEIFSFGGNFEEKKEAPYSLSPKSQFSHLDIPVPNRTLHNAGCLLNDRYLVFFSGGQNGRTPVQDTNIYIIDTVTSKMTFKEQSIISPRQGHIIIPINKTKILIHGGMSEENIFDDFYSFDIITKEIVPLMKGRPEENKLPQARAAHAAVSDIETGLIYLHGGLSRNNIALDDFWMYDTITNFWTDLSISANVALPTPRISHSLSIINLPVYDNELERSANQSEKSDDSKILPGNDCELVELENWRAVAEGQDPGTANNTKMSESSTMAIGDKKINAEVKVLAIFGGMDTEANFYNDLMVYKI